MRDIGGVKAALTKALIFSRRNLSWSETASLCERNGGHLPLYKQYHYKNLPQHVARQELATVVGLTNIISGHVGFGDITFIGLSKTVRSD